eukprot:CAMPEP_0205799468 /NCGR_PEP_ID=MMETSP0205-20121125/744_1 /ASSEMBLY_ACC=CAM_ASM_000278 /TAXON_ID=36767 /ORGANISM="Euplotes focardii, Strain TN1" /LENGTH=103 /DNA_ID=CAMNT_0053060821 /DNA_START=1368 /DNA_END=1676 /DNA_ORIENTATION=+
MREPELIVINQVDLQKRFIEFKSQKKINCTPIGMVIEVSRNTSFDTLSAMNEEIKKISDTVTQVELNADVKEQHDCILETLQDKKSICSLSVRWGGDETIRFM